MRQPVSASSLHEGMVETLHEARRRGMSHYRYSLETCEFLLAVHAPGGDLLGSPCEGCPDGWPCKTVLAVIGGLGR